MSRLLLHRLSRVCTTALALHQRPALLPPAPVSLAAPASTTSGSSGTSSQPVAKSSRLGGHRTTVDEASRVLTLHSDTALHFPLTWLRDNCRCSLCHNPSSDSRQLVMNDFDPCSRLLEATVEAGQLRLVWADGHRGCYPIDWLEQRHFTEQFQLLTEALVNFRDRNSDDLDRFLLVQRHPVLELNSCGRVRRVHLSNQQRDSVLQLPLGRVQAFYEALKAFNSLLYDPGHSLRHRLADGQLVIFENGRVLHSRTAYQGERLFHGAYLSWDETLSRRRVLQGL